MSDAGGLTMGHYDGAALELWKLAQEYTLADHFFTGAFGGSFLNHFYLVCACAPEFKDAPDDLRAQLDAQGRLLRSPDSPARAAMVRRAMSPTRPSRPMAMRPHCAPAVSTEPASRRWRATKAALTRMNIRCRRRPPTPLATA